MKRIAPGIWVDKIDFDATITVNENANTIGVLFQNGKNVVIPYPSMPTIDDFARFRDNVLEACKVFKRLAL